MRRPVKFSASLLTIQTRTRARARAQRSGSGNQSNSGQKLVRAQDLEIVTRTAAKPDDRASSKLHTPITSYSRLAGRRYNAREEEEEEEARSKEWSDRMQLLAKMRGGNGLLTGAKRRRH
ncbi:hypothetical protein NL676_030914 [Syzygium grande]|nr:hypothetical protein NL676_030914 [Syzygium grande]